MDKDQGEQKICAGQQQQQQQQQQQEQEEQKFPAVQQQQQQQQEQEQEEQKFSAAQQQQQQQQQQKQEEQKFSAVQQQQGELSYEDQAPLGSVLTMTPKKRRGSTALKDTPPRYRQELRGSGGRFGYVAQQQHKHKQLQEEQYL